MFDLENLVTFTPPTIDELSTIRLRRQPQQDRSRTKVIAAIATAERMLVESGPSSITLNSVAREAGLSVGAIHQYLPDREAIYAALADRYHHRLQDAMDSLYEKVNTVDELVDKSFAAFIDVFAKEANMHSMILQGPGSASGDLEHKTKMAESLHRLLLKLELVDDDDAGRSVAFAVFSGVDAMISDAYIIDPEGDPGLIAATRTLCAGWVTVLKTKATTS